MTEIADVEVAVRDADGIVAVSVSGEIDLATAPQLDAAFSTALDDAEVGVVFDLGGVTYFGSEGIRALVSACTRADALHLRRTIVVSPIVRRVLEVANLEELVEP